MGVKDDVASAGYRIGAVAKLTGISPDTLRIWERRYSCVTPQRSPGGGRIYSSDDIARLRLMKLRRDPLCARCGKLAEDVHHVVALADGGRNMMENLESLCHSCHSTITARERVRETKT